MTDAATTDVLVAGAGDVLPLPDTNVSGLIARPDGCTGCIGRDTPEAVTDHRGALLS